MRNGERVGFRRVALVVRLGCFLGLASTAMEGQVASLVQDVGQGLEGRSVAVRRLVPLQGAAIFLAGDGIMGRTDGTAAGTKYLKSLCEGGRCSAAIQLIGGDQRVQFWILGSHFSTDAVLWGTDGTRDGTRLLAGGDEGLSPAGPDVETRRQIFFSGQLYFVASTPEQGSELWATDGTFEGTYLVSDIAEGEASSDPRALTIVGQELFFVAEQGDSYFLWKTDGTRGGLERLVPFYGDRFTVVGNRLLREGYDVGIHRELLATDGTPEGTGYITDFDLEEPLSRDLFTAGDRAYFIAEDPQHGREVWQTDGTKSGTRRVSDSSCISLQFAALDSKVANGHLLLSCFDRAGSPTVPELWSLDLSTGREEFLFKGFIGELLTVGDRFFFVRTERIELWSTDGTAGSLQRELKLCELEGNCFIGRFLEPSSGSFIIRKVNSSGTSILLRHDGSSLERLASVPGPEAFVGAPSDFVATSQSILFLANDEGRGVEIWSTDGSGVQSLPVTGLTAKGLSGDPRSLAVLGDAVVFEACSGLERQLWTSGSAGAPAQLLQESDLILHCPLHSQARPIVGLGEVAIFESLVPPSAIWRSDGTLAGTELLLEDANLYGFEVASNHTYVLARPEALWAINGTSEAPYPFFDLTEDFLILEMESFGGIGYFASASGDLSAVRVALWRSDGTREGTVEIAGGTPFLDINLEPGRLAEVAGVVYMTTNSGQTGDELWKLGPAPNQVEVVDLVPGLGSSSPHSLTAVGDQLFFFAHDENFRTHLWTIGGDGIPSQLHEFSDFGQDPLVESQEMNGKLYFGAGGGAAGRELWVSDGTVAGTHLVADISPGSFSSSPSDLVAFNGELYMAAQTSDYGRELWKTDGTPAGTRLVHDIWPGPTSGDPEKLLVAGSTLFFTVDDGRIGRELWRLNLTGDPGCQPSDRYLCLSEGRFRVENSWRDFQDQAGAGVAVALTADTGYFWFFNQDNVESVVKVLDGRQLNDHFWTFFGALTNVEYALTVTDTETGLSRRYFNPPRRFASVGDTESFGPRGAKGAKDPQADAESPGTTGQPQLVDRYFDPSALKVGCAPGSLQLCLNDDRFAVTAEWEDFQGRVGVGTAVGLTQDTGYFWFFNEANIEVVLKVLDGRALNDHFWVFYGALSNVAYRLTVTDTETGEVKVYENPLRHFASVGDTGAFVGN